MNNAAVPYQTGLLEDQGDPDEAMAYLDAASEDGDKELIRLALSHVIEAQEIGSGRRRSLLQPGRLVAFSGANGSGRGKHRGRH